MLKPLTLLRRLPPVLLAGAALACGAPAPPPSETVPLAEFAAALRSSVETAVLDPGEPAVRASLGEGWGPSESGAETSAAARFAWGAGPQSRLAFDLVAARDLELRLRGWSFPFADGGEQRVAARVNGQEVGEAVVEPTASELRFALPAKVLAPGENLLELRYARWNEHAGELPWAVAWDRIRIVAANGGETPNRAAPAPPRIDANAGTIELAAGSAIDGTLAVAAGTRFAWESIESSGDARLKLAIAGEEGPERVRQPTGAAGDVTLLDPAGPAGVVSFALRAAGTNGSVRLRGVELRRPVSPRRPSPAPTSAPAAVPSAPPAAAPRPNLVVYLIDTLRADHLGCYGYARPTSPRIDRFAAEAVLFRHGRAQSSWTKPAIASVLTGLFPVAHGAQLRPERIHESVETLAERLQAAGYETALFTTNANITARFGFAQGWDSFRFLKHRKGRKHEHFDAAEMNAEIFAWLAERERRQPTRPLFLFVHTLDPHDPYRPREEFRRKLAPEVDLEAACCRRTNELAALGGVAAERQAAAAMALYDAEIAQNDAAFGELLDELERRGLAASSAVVLTADHGEEFLDHGGWKHGFTLYEEMLRVPIVLRLPGGEGAGRALSTPAEQIDIAPTLLALAGVAPVAELPGRDLRTLLDDEPASEPRFSFAFLARPGERSVSAASGSSKLISKSGAAFVQQRRRELFDLAADPGETTNLLDPAARPPIRVRWLEGAQAATLSRYGGSLPAEEAEIDPELEKSLRALGYF